MRDDMISRFMFFCLIPGLYLYNYLFPSVPPLEPAFLAHCTSLLSPTPSTYIDRLYRLVSAVQQTEASLPAVWIAEPGPSSSYFIGAFSSSDWHLSERPFLIVVTPATDGVTPNITILCPEFERLRAQLKPIPEQVKRLLTWVSWQESESPYEVLAEYIGAMGGVVVDPMLRSFIHVEMIAAAHQAGNDAGKTTDQALSGVKDAVALIRERKDEREIGLMRCANQVSKSGLPTKQS